ncbi:MAG: bifunctional tetrahydrofolate synthase/dihydrofolate synthase [Brachymonas sp.]|nr:bifunctional tetrahydrofolate synthase/dihydrofolate synthase [Brachymonas sp.]MDO4795187.1 bifunctional tetrahydrofolate synthase/dihydrofolate synthase [Brachymonas sp.]
MLPHAPSSPAPSEQSLTQWLAYCEQLHPKGIQGIELGLDRLRSVANRMHKGAGVRFACPVFTVAGTNGKGSTCAMLESILRHAGYRTGLFTSPHLVHFNERCKINNQPVADAILAPHFAAVEQARGNTPLSYFEFTTLAVLDCLASAQLDAVILEVGLGGRLDAVNLIDTDCAIITSIDIDHTEFLGDTREAIGAEKAGIMRAGKPAIVGDPQPPATLAAHANAIGADLWLHGRDFALQGDQQQWGWSGRGRRYSGLAWPGLRGANQLINAAGAVAAVATMHHRLPVAAQDVRLGLARAELSGRFQIVPGQPTLILDVAHNPHSVAAFVANLDAMGFYPATHAVLGAMADKDLPAMLKRLHPLIDHWYFTDLPTPRAASASQLQAMWQAAVADAAPKLTPATSQTFASPTQALQAALAAADPADRIAVFGSFHTVGAVLEDGLPRLATPHLAAKPSA